MGKLNQFAPDRKHVLIVDVDCFANEPYSPLCTSIGRVSFCLITSTLETF